MSLLLINRPGKVLCRQILASALSISMRVIIILLLGLGDIKAADNSRRPKTDSELRAWLENMVWHHRFSNEEITSATGLSIEEIAAAKKKFAITNQPPPKTDSKNLKVLPYPGGRHPRIGFLDGAVDPQRETKLSIFTPWDAESYVVADFPEAIWSNLGLTYLAHTHVPTIWSRDQVTLPPLEWEQLENGDYRMERTLPNGIRFGTQAHSAGGMVFFKSWLHNGTGKTLQDLRVQNCVMLKMARGFTAQSGDNKIIRKPFAAAHSAEGERWIITAWEPSHRPWQNPPVPCIHSDPKFPDTAPGETSQMFGLVSFYEGSAIELEFDRLEQSLSKTKALFEKR